MKTFIRLGDAFLIPAATITGVMLEDSETVSIQTSDHDPFEYIFDTPEEAKAEFERISQLLLNPQRTLPATSATEVTDLQREQHTLYMQLLYSVATKYPGESRHDTALRYILEREAQRTTSADKAATSIG